MSAITAWSYSRYAVWALCPLQFAGKHIHKWPTAGSPAMARGNDIHVGTAGFLKGTTSTLPKDVLNNPVIADLVQQIYQMPNKEVEQQWGYGANWQPMGWFDRGADKVWFRSVLDVGVLYDDMTFEAVDWKTGKRYGSQEEQMETQAIAVFQRFKPVTHVTARLAYIDEVTPNPYDFYEFKATQLQSLKDKWAKKVQPMFEATVFPPRPNDKCRFCDFSKSKGGQCAFG